MRKEDNSWEIGERIYDLPRANNDKFRVVSINGENYGMTEEMAGIAHAILLLVDAINDKPTFRIG